MKFFKELFISFIRFFTRSILYWKDFYIELKTFFIFYNVAKENSELLWERHSLKTDWIGRIYGVINLPDEMVKEPIESQESYVIQQLANYSNTLNELGLVEVIFPELQKISNSNSFLVILWPDFTALNPFVFIGNLIRLAFIAFLIYFLFNFFSANYEYILFYLEEIYNFIIRYL